MCACARRHWSGDAHDQDRHSVRSLLAAGNGYGRGTRVEKLGFDRCWDQLDPRPRADPFEITRNPPDDEQRGRSLTLSRAPHLYSTLYLTHRCVRVFLDTSRYESRDSHSSLAHCFSFRLFERSGLPISRGFSRRSIDRLFSGILLARRRSLSFPVLFTYPREYRSRNRV